jgi:hypothetical protein
MTWFKKYFKKTPNDNTWVWDSPIEDWGADYDFRTENVFEFDSWSRVPIPNDAIKPIYRSRSSVEKFKKLHCPPMGSEAVVDVVWEEIIRKFVPDDRIQFYPVRLIAHGKICDNFKWVIPFDRVESIDVKKSKFLNVFRSADGNTININVEKIVSKPGAMGKLHIARDITDAGHLLVSNDLRNALAETGEDSMFIRLRDFQPFIGR